MIAVSTAWNAFRCDSAAEIIGELQSLGFDAFELSVRFSEPMLREVESMKSVKVSSLHNYCPVPEGPREQGSGDFYFLSSPNEVERKKAVDATLRTAEWAKRLGAKAMVIHVGRVDMPHHHHDILEHRFSGQNHQAEELLTNDLIERDKIKAPFLDSALKSIAELVEKVAGDVLLGIETRLHYHEIPTFDEIAQFMDIIPPSAGGYWHDFGHAHMLDITGIAPHEEFLRRYGKRLIGMHIHDAKRDQDHGPLTIGTIDFKNLVKYIPADAISVLEIHSHASADELIRSREIWKSLLAGNKAVG